MRERERDTTRDTTRESERDLSKYDQGFQTVTTKDFYLFNVYCALLFNVCVCVCICFHKVLTSCFQTENRVVSVVVLFFLVTKFYKTSEETSLFSKKVNTLYNVSTLYNMSVLCIMSSSV